MYHLIFISLIQYLIIGGLSKLFFNFHKFIICKQLFLFKTLSYFIFKRPNSQFKLENRLFKHVLENIKVLLTLLINFILLIVNFINFILNVYWKILKFYLFHYEGTNVPVINHVFKKFFS